ncbi:hypothetical protein HYFRA_00005641 [Hymenoscyphus fraxineus]|uniref:RNA-dependent RNA polymerase n=1 Tax=Hymenoscyphus fraxineus TaxID=746836 RepID=A0A9N9KUN3_9HELO|nr:hypothetical protein HYFRA_00005641 [Hymenoscyphus fraxineus]
MSRRPRKYQQASSAFYYGDPNAWKAWPELAIRLSHLQDETTTKDIFNTFEKYGDISRIEIFREDRRSNGESPGRIIFSPVPTEEFWYTGTCSIKPANGGTGYPIGLEIRKDDQSDGKMQSPARPRVWFDKTMHMNPSKLHFGLMENPETMMQLQTVTHPSFVVDFRRRRLTVKFGVEHKDPRHKEPHTSEYVSFNRVGKLDRTNRYMFQVSFEHLNVIHRLNLPNRSFQLLLQLGCPPQFYRKREGSTIHSDELVWSEFSNTWYRQTDIVYDPDLNSTSVIALHKTMPVIDIGRWTTYLFEFPSDPRTATSFAKILDALQDFNINIVPINKLYITPGRPSELWDMIDTPKSTTLNAKVAEFYLPFEVRYQLEVCISREVINEYNVSRSFVAKLAGIASKDATKARNILEKVAEMGIRFYDPMSIFEDDQILSFYAKTDIPHYCAFARKATVTPTTVHYSSPTVETTNRVLRHYAKENDQGRFLRVQFTDELLDGKIHLCKNELNDELFSRVYRTLFNGIQIGDRHFKFLAFGNSQFRENGAYFFCETDELTCGQIRDWMGSFSHINVAAKYAARLGQCFSTTRAINGLSAPTVVTIPDIERNGFTFTDGVGKISPFLAQMIAHELGIRAATTPSAFQFRLGGCKGILVTSPDAVDRQVHIRKSQQKFTATYNGLEIIRCSHYSCATLNRQTITILSSLGVPDESFLDLMTDQLSNYESAMKDDVLARGLLLRYIDENQMTINIAQMVHSGFMETQDPFVVSLLHLWRSWSIKLLKEKAKIVIEDGAFVLGCVDETSTLKGYHQPTVSQGVQLPVEELPEIFIQVPLKGGDPKNPIYTVIEGICLVGRNPSLHPGDLRVVRAVDAPSLRHLRDVVVFPSTGDRDIPSMCSGGDLDGDDYFVIWDNSLRPREWNATPMNYTSPPPRVQQNPVEVEDLMKFFVRYMKNDSLPSIALAHQAQSDNLGVKNPTCIELAELHSKAVDYVKTGYPAEMPKRLKPRKWPHFMESRHRPKELYYRSTKIVGQLYDKVENIAFKPKYDLPFDRRVLAAYEIDDSLMAAARKLKSAYDYSMRQIMSQHDIRTEFEVWTTFILSKPRVGSDYKQQEAIGRVSDELKDTYRAACIKAAGGSDYGVLGPFVASMYRVTKEELDIALAECRATRTTGDGITVPVRRMEPAYMPLISFPWLFEKVLGRIATGVDMSEDLADLGFVPLSFKNDREAGGAKPATQDYIRREDGVIVHRGQEIDFFEDHGDYGSEDGAAGPYGGLVDIDTIGYNHSGGDQNGSSYGGMRDVALAGFRSPEPMGDDLDAAFGALGLKESARNSVNVPTHPVIDLTSESDDGNDRNSVDAPIPPLIDLTFGNDEEDNREQNEDEDDFDLDNGYDVDRQMSMAERDLLTEEPTQEKEDDEVEAEQVQFDIEESAFDRLARMMDS